MQFAAESGALHDSGLPPDISRVAAGGKPVDFAKLSSRIAALPGS